MPTRTLALLPAALLVLLLGCPSGPPPLEVTGTSSLVDGVDHFDVVAQTRKGEIVRIYPGFEEVEADESGRAEFHIVPEADHLRDGVLHVTASIRLKGDPPMLEKSVEVPRPARLVPDVVLPKLVCSTGQCTIALDRGLSMRLSRPPGAEVTIGGIPIVGATSKLPGAAILTSKDLDAVLGGKVGKLYLPVVVTIEGQVFEGDLPVKRTRVMDALGEALAEVPGSGVAWPTDGTGAVLAWAGVSGHWPIEFYGGEVTKLGDIGRIAVAETTSTGKRDCGTYGNAAGDTQRQKLDVMRITVKVYDVRTGDVLTSKTFQPSARCPDSATQGRTTSVILPRERDVVAWVKSL